MAVVIHDKVPINIEIIHTYIFLVRSFNVNVIYIQNLN